MSMTELDYVVLAVMGISVLVGLWRGMVREILAIVGWVAAAVLTLAYAGDIAQRLPFPSLGQLPLVALASVIIVVVTLLVVGIVGKLITMIMTASQLTFEDRLLGGVIGVLRGILMACILIFVLGLSSNITSSDYWKKSMVIKPAEDVIEWSLPHLPRWIRVIYEDNKTAKPVFPALTQSDDLEDHVEKAADAAKETLKDLSETVKDAVEKKAD